MVVLHVQQKDSFFLRRSLGVFVAHFNGHVVPVERIASGKRSAEKEERKKKNGKNKSEKRKAEKEEREMNPSEISIHSMGFRIPCKIA